MSLSKKIKQLINDEGELKDSSEIVEIVANAVKVSTGITLEELIKDIQPKILTVKGEIPLDIVDDEIIHDQLTNAYVDSVAEASTDLSVGTLEMKLGRSFASNTKLLGVLKVLSSTEEKSKLL